MWSGLRLNKQYEEMGSRMPTGLCSLQTIADAVNDSVDYIYDLTAEVGRALTGFRHDQTAGTMEYPPFQVLTRSR
jgi:hypothetical protein